jgi:alpha-tubulin suppressor-like RCC1 family protein
MGHNEFGQLGINEPYLEMKQSPVLVDQLLNLQPVEISCGSLHTLVVTKQGDAFAWGSNEFGQCGTSTGLK